MKINPCNINNGMRNNTYEPSFKGIASVTKTVVSKAALKNGDVLAEVGKRVGEYVNSPEQKLITALLALAFQPVIDLTFAEEDQKVDSAIKTTSKLIAGAITGVSIRALAIKLSEFLIMPNSDDIGKVRKAIKDFFTPTTATKLLDANHTEIAYRKLADYSKVIGNIVAVAVMIFYSNANIDVPLTTALRDLISGMVKEDKTFIQSLTDVVNDRKKQKELQSKQPKDVGFFEKVKSKITDFFTKEKKETK